MAHDEEIPASKVASQWRFDRHEIDEWMKSQRPGANDSLDNKSVNVLKRVKDDTVVGRCLSYKHGRPNVAVRFCPICSEMVNKNISSEM